MTRKLQITLLIIWIIAILIFNIKDKPQLDSWVWSEFRLPRIMGALFTGIGLSLSGLMMQTLFRNPLAGPFLIGVTPGATLGMAIYLFAGSILGIEISPWGSQISSLSGALIALAVQLAFNRGFDNPIRLLLTGMVMGFVFSAGVQILMHLGSAQDLQRYTFWGMGSFDQVTSNEWVGLVIPSLVIGAWLWRMRNALDAYLLGEEYAFTSGISIKAIRRFLILGGAILAGWITSFVGPIGFVGLVAPHIAKRSLQTESHAQILFPTVLWGMALTLTADTLAHISNNITVLPVNPIMALIGAPILIYSLYKQNKSTY